MASRRFRAKYLHKYVRKRAKLGLPRTEASVVQRTLEALEHGTPFPSSLPPECRAYALGLAEAVRRNEGLAHAKVREYWLYRGPRQALTMLCFVLGTLAVHEVLRTPSPTDRLVDVVTGALAMLTACVMLYYRLPDSIHSSVSRSAHDHYVATKHAMVRSP